MDLEIYRPIDDPLYTVTSQKPPIDKDTQNRGSTCIPAQTGGSRVAATPAACLNRPGNNRTTFDFSQDAGARMRWGCMGLRMKMVFASTDGTAACPGTTAVTTNSPPWNLVAQLIRWCAISIDNSTKYYTTTGDTFEHEFTARLFRNYDYSTLNQMGEMLFTPIGSKSYTGTTVAIPANNTGADAAWLERGQTWCVGDTHQRVITKIIPFNDLFPRLPDAIYKNMRRIKIEIDWKQTQDLLEHRTSTAAQLGSVFLIECDIVKDYYTLAPAQSVAAVSEKINPDFDYLPYLNARCDAYQYTPGGAILIPAVRNFDSVMILQPAKGITSTTDPVATFASSAEYVMGFAANGGGATASKVLERHDTPTAGNPGFTSVHISFGGNQYPQSPLQLVQNQGGSNCFDASELYYEYKKALNRVGSRNMGPAIPYDMFRSTMPFIFLRPFASDAPRLSNESKDLTIRLTGGVACQIMIIVFTYNVQVLRPDGSGVVY